MKLREHGKAMVNRLAAGVGARLVGSQWGPRGVWSTLRRVHALGFAPATVLDIGASDGQWTRECLRVFPQARYFLVDPLEANRADLERLAAAQPRVSIWSGAVGAEPGWMRLHSHGDQSSLLPSKDFQADQVQVEVRPLDSFLRPEGFLAPMLLKADVQGYELEVLKGARQCLAMTELLLLEVSFRRLYEGGVLADEVIAFAGGEGFRIYDICTYIQRPADNELAQSDLIFVRENSRLLRREGWS